LLQELADTCFGELNCDTEVDFAQHEVKTGVARRFGQALRCYPQARKDRLIHASVEQAQLERIEHVERIAPLGRPRASFARSGPPPPAERSEHRQLKSLAVTQRPLNCAGTSCSLTLNEPPAVRRTVVGVEARAVPLLPVDAHAIVPHRNWIGSRVPA